MMSSIFRKTLCLCVLTQLFFIGCAAPKAIFKSQKDPAYHEHLTRVLIVCPEEMGTSFGRDFSERMLKRLTEALSQHGATAEVVQLKRGQLDTISPVKIAANQFRPHQLLQVALIRIYNSSNISASSDAMLYFDSRQALTFGFGIINLPTDKVVWKGEAQYNLAPRPEAVADQLVERLVAEQFL